jgi:tight adherence protein C
MLVLLAALSFGGAAFLVAETVTLPARRRSELVRRAATYGREDTARDDGDQPSGSLFDPLLRIAAAVVVRVAPKANRENTGQRLLAAGLSQQLTPERLLGAKGLLCALGACFGALVGFHVSAAGGIVFALGLGALGYQIPGLFVSSRITQRREQVRAALPDALDLLAVSVEAGLGFDGAISKLTESMHGPLIEEFALTLNEMRIGESRAEALRRMAARMDVLELSSFVRAVVQADQLGSSLAAILRAQATDTRMRRQFDAEEKAMKAPIKMLLPTAVFIFPAMFIVILGPALLNFGKGLG